MDLKELKDMCYSANRVTSIAEQHEKKLKVTFIKEYFFKNLKKMRVTEGGCSILEIEDKCVRVGVDNLRVLLLMYDPQEPKHSSMSGITTFSMDDNGNKIEIAIEMLTLRELTAIFVALSMDIK